MNERTMRSRTTQKEGEAVAAAVLAAGKQEAGSRKQECT